MDVYSMMKDPSASIFETVHFCFWGIWDVKCRQGSSFYSRAKNFQQDTSSLTRRLHNLLGKARASFTVWMLIEEQNSRSR